MYRKAEVEVDENKKTRPPPLAKQTDKLGVKIGYGQ